MFAPNARKSAREYRRLLGMARRLLPRCLTFPCQGGRHRVILHPSGRISTPDHDWAAEKVSEALGLPPSPCARVLEAARSFGSWADAHWRGLAPSGTKRALAAMISLRRALKRVLRDQAPDEWDMLRRAVLRASPAHIASPEQLRVWAIRDGLEWAQLRIRFIARRRIHQIVRRRRRPPFPVEVIVQVTQREEPQSFWSEFGGRYGRLLVLVRPSLGMLQARGLDVIRAGNRWFIALGIAYIRDGRLGILANSASGLVQCRPPVILDMENPFPAAKAFAARGIRPLRVIRVERPEIHNLAVEEADIRLPADLERRRI